MAATPLSDDRASIRLLDLVRVGFDGLMARPGRTALTALGVAIGIASMVTVVGISASSKAGLMADLDRLGTNLLQIKPGDSIAGDGAQLPTDAAAMVAAMPDVIGTAGVSQVSAAARRNRFDDAPYGLSVLATDGSIADLLLLTLATGRPIDEYNQSLPIAVLGAVAAERLGVRDLASGPTVSIGRVDVQVVGILDRHRLHPDIDRSILVGALFAGEALDAEPHHSAIYVRVVPGSVESTRPLLARAANPAAPHEVAVSRPSDALAAQAQVDRRLQTLLVSLGAVALLVGGIGIANVMVISVLERRGEIGLRRALGATRHNIRVQFVIEAVTLAALGGSIGITMGLVATSAYARGQGWLVSIPVTSLLGGVALALAIGGIAGLYPAGKAARLDPADAIRPRG